MLLKLDTLSLMSPIFYLKGKDHQTFLHTFKERKKSFTITKYKGHQFSPPRQKTIFSISIKRRNSRIKGCKKFHEVSFSIYGDVVSDTPHDCGRPEDDCGIYVFNQVFHSPICKYNEYIEVDTILLMVIRRLIYNNHQSMIFRDNTK